MQTVHSHYRNYSNPTALYFDPEQEFVDFRAEKGGDDKFLTTLRVFGKIINQAYADGLRDGKEIASK